MICWLFRHFIESFDRACNSTIVWEEMSALTAVCCTVVSVVVVSTALLSLGRRLGPGV